MKIIDKINLEGLREMASTLFEDMVKGVVDVQKGILALDAELHSDLEKLLLEAGSEQKNLWGINLYPDLFEEDDFVEFDSMINLKPSQGNRSRGVEDKTIQAKIIKVVREKVVEE